MPHDDWRWSKLTRAEVREHGRAVARGAIERAGFTTEQEGSVIRASRRDQHIEVHVRTLRDPVYAFWPKKTFPLSPNLFAALVLLVDTRPPAAYLVPAIAWRTPNALLVSRDYEGLASDPEWGLNLSGRTQPLLDQYRISRTLGAKPLPPG